MKSAYKIFTESLQRAGIDGNTIQAVSEIHKAIYEAAGKPVAAETDKEESSEETHEENPGKNPDELSDDKFNDDADCKQLITAVLQLLIAKSNSYQNYHWNAESKALHELAQRAYELYGKMRDSTAETYVSMFNEKISMDLWKRVVDIADRDAFAASIHSNLEEFTHFREKLDDKRTYGLNSSIDAMLDEITNIKYQLARFFEDEAR